MSFLFLFLNDFEALLVIFFEIELAVSKKDQKSRGGLEKGQTQSEKGVKNVEKGTGGWWRGDTPKGKTGAWDYSGQEEEE